MGSNIADPDIASSIAEQRRIQSSRFSGPEQRIRIEEQRAPGYAPDSEPPGIAPRNTESLTLINITLFVSACLCT